MQHARGLTRAAAAMDCGRRIVGALRCLYAHTLRPILPAGARELTAGAALICMAFSAGAAAEELISFPARAADLPSGAYWSVAEFSEGCCTLDLQVKRWEGTQWDNGSGNAQNQSYDWNVPLYAPANGVIASCWRNFPDDKNDQIFTGGNHVAIVTDKGNVISLNHLKQGTIPKELCPSNAGNEQYPSVMTKQDGWRVAAYIKPSDRPRVQEGQFIGRVGELGNAKGPHLHMSLHRVTDPGDDNNRTKKAEESSPLNIRYAWAHPFHETQQVTADGWFRLRGTDFAKDAGCEPDCNKMLHASPYLRRADANAGPVKHSDVLFLSGNRAITASVSAQDGKLKLITWELVGVDQIQRKGEIEAGAAKEVALAEVASNRVLAAVRQADDTLKMIAFQVGANGNLQRLADISAGEVTELDMVAFGEGKRAATAVRGPAGNFKLIVWDIETGGSPKIVRLGEADGGTVVRPVDRARQAVQRCVHGGQGQRRQAAGDPVEDLRGWQDDHARRACAGGQGRKRHIGRVAEKRRRRRHARFPRRAADHHLVRDRQAATWAAGARPRVPARSPKSISSPRRTGDRT